MKIVLILVPENIFFFKDKAENYLINFQHYPYFNEIAHIRGFQYYFFIKIPLMSRS
jgi:hypothetical protein